MSSALRAAYDQRLETGEIRADPAQAEAVGGWTRWRGARQAAGAAGSATAKPRARASTSGGRSAAASPC